MKIDRHNYEELLILYLDNELSSDQRRDVEEFIQNNPDLKDELDLLSQYKLTPDTSVVFDNKNILFRQENLTTIHTGNCGDWMLLYIDNELTLSQQQTFEAFIADHPLFKKELDQLLQTKMQPEPISFPGKELLYKKTGKTITISLYWRRAAAAIIFMMLVAAGALVVTGKRSKDEIAKIPAENNKPVQNTPTDFEQQGTSNLAKTTPISTDQSVALRNENKEVAVKENSGQKNPPYRQEKKQVIQNPGQVLADNTPKSNNLPLPLENKNVKEDVAINYPAEINEIKNQSSSVNTTGVTNNYSVPSDLTYATFSNTDNAILDQPDGKKNKLRGLLRKVTRTFEKTTKVDATDDNDRLLIGGLAIKLK